MKELTILLLALAAPLFAGDDKPVPVFPSDLKLISGAVFHEVTLARFDRDFVIVLYHGQKTPFRYDAIVPDQRAVILALRAAAPPPPPPAAAPASAPASADTTLEGQVFIATQGVDSYKLGGITVYLFPGDRLSRFESTLTIDLGEPLATAVTDASGKFRLKSPATADFFLFARGERTLAYRTGNTRERYEWIVPSTDIADRAAVILSNQNQHTPAKTVKIGAIVFDGTVGEFHSR